MTDERGAVGEGRRGREARRTARMQRQGSAIPWITREIPVTEPGSRPLLAFPVDLSRGTNTLELHAWKWRPGARPMSVLITNVRAIPSPALQATPRAHAAAEAKPVRSTPA